MNWTNKDEDKIRSLISEGKTSREISVIFGTTKNAIVSICKRRNIRLANSKNIYTRQNEDLTPKSILAERQKMPNFIRIGRIKNRCTTEQATPTMSSIPLEKCSERTCRFIIGDPRNMRCCGEKTKDGRVYCDAHHTLTHTISSPYVPKSSDYRR